MDVGGLIEKLPKFNIEDLSFDELPYREGELTRLGQGARGIISIINAEPNKVIKVQLPIPYPPKGKCSEEGYNITHPFTVYSSPFPIGKQVLTMPAIVSEGLVGGMLNKLIDSRYTINFLRTYELGYLPNDSTSFITLEKLLVNIWDMVDTEADFLGLIFQLLHGVMVAQEVLSFTHYDMHVGNILYKTTDKPWIIYPLINKRVAVKTKGNVFIIADYGTAVAKYKNTLVKPFPFNCIQRSFAEFNSQYDILAFLGSLMVPTPSPFLKEHPLVIKFRNKFDRRFLLDLYKVFFNIPNELKSPRSEEDFAIMEGWILDNYFSVQTPARPRWRPKDLVWIKHFDMKGTHELLDDLATLLEKYGMAKEVNDVTEVNEFPNSIRIEPLPKYSLSKRVPPIMYFTEGKATVESQPIPGIFVRSYSIRYRDMVRYYNLTPSKRESTICEETKSNVVEKVQYITEVAITPAIALRLGYRFNLNCCRSSLLDFMTTNKQEGVAINGGFFDINKSYRPMSIFKNKYLEKTNVQIPRIYYETFGMYHIDSSGMIHLGRISQEKLQSSQYEAVGPLLVYNGKVMVNEELINTVHKNKLAFQCAVPLTPGDKTKFLTQDKAAGNACNKPLVNPNVLIPNCDAILGGELSHAGNPNPRSMILNRVNSKGEQQIVFVVVEGRNERGDGMDLIELANFAKNRYNADRVIGLDGGMSSNIILKIPGDPVYYVINEKEKTSYPLGSIISFTKNV